MESPRNTTDEIRRVFQEKSKEYGAFDLTLNALAALRFVLEKTVEVKDETLEVDLQPRLAPSGDAGEPYTPDGLVMQRPEWAFILELKTSWNDSDPAQVIKYAGSPGTLHADGSLRPFGPNRCVMLGYQNTPGEPNLELLFRAWQEAGIGFPLVVFRYSLEVSPTGHRLFFVRAPDPKNGLCPPTYLGRAFNSVRGFPVSADSFEFMRPRFHRSNDQAIPSYAAVLWWTTYAKHYLTDDQQVEMADRGHLAEPLRLKLSQLSAVPKLADVETPLRARDVRHALEFLRQAQLVRWRAKQAVFEVNLKDDRHVRTPTGMPGSVGHVSTDIAAKIIARWCFYKVMKPEAKKERGRKLKGARGRRQRDKRTLPLFPD